MSRPIENANSNFEFERNLKMNKRRYFIENYPYFKGPFNLHEILQQMNSTQSAYLYFGEIMINVEIVINDKCDNTIEKIMKEYEEYEMPEKKSDDVAVYPVNNDNYYSQKPKKDIGKKNNFGVYLDYVEFYNDNFELENSLTPTLEGNLIYSNRFQENLTLEIGLGYMPIRLQDFDIKGHKVSLGANLKFYPLSLVKEPKENMSIDLDDLYYITVGLYLPFTYFNYENYTDNFGTIRNYEFKSSYVGAGIAVRNGLEIQLGKVKFDAYLKGTYEYLDGEYYTTLSAGIGFLF